MIARIFATLVLFVVLMMAIGHGLGEYGFALPFIFPLGGAPK